MSRRKITIENTPFEWQFITQHGLSAGIKFWQDGKSRIVSMEELGYQTGDDRVITPSDVTKWAERALLGQNLGYPHIHSSLWIRFRTSDFGEK